MFNQQGSDAWKKERLGNITASRIADMLAKTKTGEEAASRANYRAQLVAERMTGAVQESYSNDAMAWGTEQEPFARIAYELDNGVMVDEVGFVMHPTIARSGASPDGCIGEDGLLEIKCPKTATHIGYLLDGKPPTKYIKQMGWQLACTARKWCDFVSYDPRMPEALQYFCVRYIPDAKDIGILEYEVKAFDKEVEDLIIQLNMRF